MIFQGRRHWYEGEGWSPVVIPAYIAKQLGCTIMLLTNAAGGISFPPGSIMVLNDHNNHMFGHPLIGPHHEELGVRFPDQSNIYPKELRELIRQATEEVGVEYNEGIYIACSGPTYETPAEIQAFKRSGADAVGMSTVPEAIIGNATGLKIAAISCISNHAAGISKVPLCHQEVMDTMDKIMPNMVKLIPRIVELFSNL